MGITLTNCPTPIGRYVSSGGVSIPAPCNSWRCPVCGKVKKNKVIDRIHDGQVLLKQDESLHPDYRFFRFLTLTQSVDDPVPIMKAWNRFRAYFAKKGIKFVYFGVKEFTKKGKRHLHILVNRYLRFEDIKYAWMLATEGYSWRVWINRVDIKSGAGYMTKYMSKTLDHEMFKRGERRYFHSRGIYFKNHRKFKPTHKFRFEFGPKINFDAAQKFYKNIRPSEEAFSWLEQAKRNKRIRASAGVNLSDWDRVDWVERCRAQTEWDSNRAYLRNK